MRVEIIFGNKYGRLTPVKAVPNKSGRSAWECVCECGNRKVVLSQDLKSGHILSCGCFLKERRMVNTRRHGATAGGKATTEYHAWLSMVKRCTCPKNKSYRNYGGRGIKVCERWSDFVNFLADMGKKPDGLTLERIDNNKGYSPENCKWATLKEQARNRRITTFMTHDGVTRSRPEWAEIMGITNSTIRSRMEKGWSVHRALTEPVQRQIGHGLHKEKYE